MSAYTYRDIIKYTANVATAQFKQPALDHFVIEWTEVTKFETRQTHVKEDLQTLLFTYIEWGVGRGVRLKNATSGFIAS